MHTPKNGLKLELTQLAEARSISPFQYRPRHKRRPSLASLTQSALKCCMRTMADAAAFGFSLAILLAT
jgi:hypothetical protein